jgi:hypothetical protein
MTGAGSGSSGASGHGTAGAVSARTGAAEQAAAEVARLQDSVQFAVSALVAIGDSARVQSRYSARVRVLELEVLPAGPYLGLCVQALHDELAGWRTPRRWPPQLTAQVDEIQAMLERAIEITATVDIPGELGMPLELVSTVQSGALAGLGCLQRLRKIVNPPNVEHRPILLRPTVDEPQPSSSARCLVHTASRLLPPGNRDRYAEEFRADPHQAGCAGCSGAGPSVDVAVTPAGHDGKMR